MKPATAHSRWARMRTARKFYSQTVEAWPENEPPNPELLIRYSRVLNSVDIGSAPEFLTQAVEIALASGDSGQAAEAETLMCEMYWLMGRRDDAFEHLRAAEALVENEPSSYAKAYVLANVSRFRMLAGDREHAIRVGRQALAMAEELGLDELQAHALDNIGVSRLGIGDRGGVEDLERSIQIADAINSVESARAYGNLGSALLDLGEVDRSFEMLEEARRRAERFGLDDWLLWLRGMMTWAPYYSGDWDEALHQLDELIDEFMQHPFWMESACRVLRARMRLARGDAAGAREDADRALELARAAKDPQVLWPALTLSARLLVPSDAQGAEALIEEVLSEWEARRWHGGAARASGPRMPPSCFRWSDEKRSTSKEQSRRTSLRPGAGRQSPTSQEIFSRPPRSTARWAPGPTRPTRGCGLPRTSSVRGAGPRRMPSSSGHSRSGEPPVRPRTSGRARRCCAASA